MRLGVSTISTCLIPMGMSCRLLKPLKMSAGQESIQTRARALIQLESRLVQLEVHCFNYRAFNCGPRSFKCSRERYGAGDAGGGHRS